MTLNDHLEIRTNSGETLVAVTGNTSTTPRALVSPPPPPPAPPSVDPILRGRQSIAGSQYVQSRLEREVVQAPEDERLRDGRGVAPRTIASPRGAFGVTSTVAADVIGITQDEESRTLSGDQGVMARLLLGLEEGDLSVGDVLGVLETDVRRAPTVLQANSRSPRNSIASGQAAARPGRDSSPAVGRPAFRGSEDVAQRESFLDNNSLEKKLSSKTTSLSSPGCNRCSVLEKQLGAVAQALSGVSARIFNWSLNAPLRPQQQTSLWELVVQYLTPCAITDQRIADTCNDLKAAINNQNNVVAEGTEELRSRQITSESLAPAGVTTSQAFDLQDRDVYRSMSLIGPSLVAAGSTFGAAVASLHHQARHPEVLKAVVSFSSSPLAREISGTYQKIDGALVSDRPVYMNGRYHLLFRGRAWLIQVKRGDDTQGLDEHAEVLAYVQDSAGEPWSVTNQWRVTDGAGGFVVDGHSSVRPAPTRGSSDNRALLELTVGEQEGRLGWRCSAGPPHPVLVEGIETRGWAARFGLRHGDELIEIDRRRVETMSTEEFANAMRMRPQALTFARSPDDGNNVASESSMLALANDTASPVEGYVAQQDAEVQVGVGEVPSSLFGASPFPTAPVDAPRSHPIANQKTVLVPPPEGRRTAATSPQQEPSGSEKRNESPSASETTRGRRRRRYWPRSQFRRHMCCSGFLF
eukprot:TRINITY_DN35166_c0_g1_i3.p1 TRINITY_DN35166_c0_g1~~TRINITY_DN35166_c0_g1_i3.p1  ORF type:complete len:695 (+),score=87.43 TRINITY_DN35166_c0_g1_i3:292-2376(+)